jgi:hypothetical protein
LSSSKDPVERRIFPGLPKTRKGAPTTGMSNCLHAHSVA